MERAGFMPAPKISQQHWRSHRAISILSPPVTREASWKRLQLHSIGARDVDPERLIALSSEIAYNSCRRRDVV